MTLNWEEGGRKEVPVYRTGADPAVFQSPAMIFEDPNTCRGLRFCEEGEEWNWEFDSVTEN